METDKKELFASLVSEYYDDIENGGTGKSALNKIEGEVEPHGRKSYDQWHEVLSESRYYNGVDHFDVNDNREKSLLSRRAFQGMAEEAERENDAPELWFDLFFTYEEGWKFDEISALALSKMEEISIAEGAIEVFATVAYASGEISDTEKRGRAIQNMFAIAEKEADYRVWQQYLWRLNDKYITEEEIDNFIGAKGSRNGAIRNIISTAKTWLDWSCACEVIRDYHYACSPEEIAAIKEGLLATRDPSTDESSGGWNLICYWTRNLENQELHEFAKHHLSLQEQK